MSCSVSMVNLKSSFHHVNFLNPLWKCYQKERLDDVENSNKHKSQKNSNCTSKNENDSVREATIEVNPEQI